MAQVIPIPQPMPEHAHHQPNIKNQNAKIKITSQNPKFVEK